MTCFKNEIHTVLIGQNILEFLTLIKNSENISIAEISEKINPKLDFEQLFIECIQKNLIYIQNDN